MTEQTTIDIPPPTFGWAADVDSSAGPAGTDVRGGFAELRAAGVHVVLDCRGSHLPTVLHWGSDLGVLTASGLDDMVQAAVPPVVPNSTDQPAEAAGLLLEHSRGWLGRPGLSGHRDGADWSPLFVVDSTILLTDASPGGTVVVTATDSVAQLALRVELVLEPSGLLRLRTTLGNASTSSPYTVDALSIGLPVPGVATELLDLAGRWGRERAPQRQPFSVGSRVRENMSGRTGADASLVLAAGTPGFGFRSGEVWAVHVGWSGNHRHVRRAAAYRRDGARRRRAAAARRGQARPGRGVRHPVGLRVVRRRPGRGVRPVPRLPAGPARRTRGRSARPVILNTWEAVYFDHDLDRLTRARRRGAPRSGVERFVLDDGWFRGRRDDHAGLGDWYRRRDGLARRAAPAGRPRRGLGHGVRALGRAGDGQPGLGPGPGAPGVDPGHRRPACRRCPSASRCSTSPAPRPTTTSLERLDALLDEYADRLPQVGPQPGPDRRRAPARPASPGVHGQTLAVYRLLDELRAGTRAWRSSPARPAAAGSTSASCERTDRVWASDCIDALERQQIQRWTQLLLPPELIGTHVGAAASHTTGRTPRPRLPGGTALFGHFGIEWDLTAATPRGTRGAGRWVALLQATAPAAAHRPASSRPTTRTRHSGCTASSHPDGAEALFAAGHHGARSVTSPPGRVRLPGLDPDADYRVRPVATGDHDRGHEPPARPGCATRESPARRVLVDVGSARMPGPASRAR